MNADDLARLLDELGKRLGPTGEYGFSLAVRQVYVEAIVAIGSALLVTILVSVVARPIYWRLQRLGDDGIVSGLLGLGVTMVLVMLGIMSVVSVQNLLNPEYVAIQNILRLVAP